MPDCFMYASTCFIDGNVIIIEPLSTKALIGLFSLVRVLAVQVFDYPLSAQ